MYYNTPYLTWQNAIKRDDTDDVIRNATYLNTLNPNAASINQFYGWTAVHIDGNGVVLPGTPQILAVDDNYLVPWRLALKILPNRTERLKLSITGVAANGTTTAELDSLTYIFHALFKSSEKITIETSLQTDSPASSIAPVITNFDAVDEYLTVRSNFVELSPNNDLPTSSYTGSNITFTITITITNHGGNGQTFYMTCPFLYQENEYKQNPFVSNSTKYIPQVLLEIDKAQSPQYPMSKLMHALNYSSAQTSALTARFWKLDLEELPVEYDGTEDFAKSKLVDPNLADYEYLSWLAQFNGTSLRDNVYAPNPADATQTESLSVRAATTSNGTLATAYAAGQTIDGVLLIAGNRILIKNQSTASQNGIYVVNATGAPTRAADMPAGSLNISAGFSILVRDGDLNSGTIWRLTNASNPTVGTDALTFGIKQISVVAATTTAGTFTGPASFQAGAVVDNVTLLAGNKILIKDQASTSTNGVYVVQSSGAPARIGTLPATLTLSNYLDVFVTGGLSNKYKIFRSTSNNAEINTNSLNFSEVSLNAYEANEDTFARWQISNGYWGYKAGTREAFDGILDRYLTGTKYRTYTLTGFLLSIKTLYDETPWAAAGRSPLLEALLEPARPAGYKLTVEVVHDLRFTFDNEDLGEFNDDPLG
jgi:hypothetical protein